MIILIGDWLPTEAFIRENEHNLAQCMACGCAYILIDGEYAVEPL